MLVGEVFARMGLDSKDYEKGLNKLEGYTQKKALTLGTIFKGAFSFALGIGLLSGFRSLGGAITDFVNTAARTEVLDIAMQSVARSSGYAIAALNEQRKAVMELGIAEQEASQILTRFMQAQLDTADAAKLAKVAQDAAVIAGYNSSQAAEQMTEAIAKQRPELLSAFGMTRNMNEIYKDYAGTVGKTAAQLSEAEKKQAMLNYILKEGEKIAGTYEASMGAVGKQIGSLPRYWDTLKNAIAKPLALPAISVIVEALTNGLKSGIAWAEANASSLQRWGQTAANVAGYVVKGFRFVTRTFAENWGMIRFAATALITYAAATKTASAATAIFRAITLAVNGQLTTKIPLLSLVSTAVGIYRVQMALAAAQGIVLTGALAKLRVALYAVHTALGPIGWALLGLSLLVAGGLHLWNKYTQSLQKTPKLSNKIEDSTSAVNKAINDQAEALKAAGKAAAKNLQPFDEINQLQKEMATGTDYLDAINEALDLDIGMAGIGLPPVDAGEFLESLEEIKPSFSGFLEWLWDEWEGWVQSWGWVDTLAGWIVETFYDAEEGVWSLKKAWDKWTETVSGWDWVQTLSDWIVETFYNAEEGVWSLKRAWGIWTDYVQNWDWVQNLSKWITDTFYDAEEGVWSLKGAWETFTAWVGEVFGPTWDTVTEKWERFKTWAGNFWSVVKEKWNEFKVWAGNVWNAFWDPIRQKWNTFKSWAGELLAPVRQKWNSFVTWARGIWDGLLKKWNEIKRWSLWTWIKNKVDWLKNVFNFRWSLPKIKLPRFKVSWSKAGFWGKVGDFLGLPGKPIIDVTWLAKGGILTRPTLIGAGEAGPEAVIPLTGSVFDDLADRLAAALQKTQLAGAGAGAGGGGDIYVYIGNEQVDAYVHRSQDRRNTRSNGR